MCIRIIKDKKLFCLDSKTSSYIFCIDDNGLVRHLYWGKKLLNIEDFDITPIKEWSSNDSDYEITPEELTAWGGLRYKEPSIKADLGDGTRDVKLVYVGYEISDNHLRLALKDEFYDFYIYLNYKTYLEADIFERYIELENKDENIIDLETIYSGEFNLKGIGYSLSNVYGRWGGEQRGFREKLSYGKKVLEGRRGTTGHNHSPYFVLDKNADEFSGEVYYGVLCYDGSFKLCCETTQYDQTRILLGINDFDSCIRLNKGCSFTAPSVYFGYSSKGFSYMSNTLNSFSLNYLLPKENRHKLRPVLYNSWEATYFDVSCEGQIELAEKAAELGVELFVVDDGWFGGRNSDKSGLGDWFESPDKFPEGLTPLVKRVNELGMEFGIWVEPEMVNPDSELYRRHPDWVYGFNNRRNSLARNQLVLNMTKPEVWNYVYTCLDLLLTNNNIAFVKWDMNRPLSEAGASNLEAQREVWYRHNRAVLSLVDKLREKHPEVVFEGCASGGGRIDFEALMHFDQFWTSDNTDALDRLTIQEGYSLIYPIKAMRAWVTDCPNFLSNRVIPLEFRFHSAFMGSLGIGCDLNRLTHEDMELCKKKIDEYKAIRYIVQEGSFYRLSSIERDKLHAVQYTKDEEGVLLVFKQGQSMGEHVHCIKLRDLQENEKYNVNIDGDVICKTGEYLMQLGITITLKGDYASKVIRIIPAK